MTSISDEKAAAFLGSDLIQCINSTPAKFLRQENGDASMVRNLTATEVNSVRAITLQIIIEHGTEPFDSKIMCNDVMIMVNWCFDMDMEFGGFSPDFRNTLLRAAPPVFSIVPDVGLLIALGLTNIRKADDCTFKALVLQNTAILLEKGKRSADVMAQLAQSESSIHATPEKPKKRSKKQAGPSTSSSAREAAPDSLSTLASLDDRTSVLTFLGNKACITPPLDTEPQEVLNQAVALSAQLLAYGPTLKWFLPIIKGEEDIPGPLDEPLCQKVTSLFIWFQVLHSVLTFVRTQLAPKMDPSVVMAFSQAYFCNGSMDFQLEECLIFQAVKFWNIPSLSQHSHCGVMNSKKPSWASLPEVTKQELLKIFIMAVSSSPCPPPTPAPAPALKVDGQLKALKGKASLSSALKPKSVHFQQPTSLREAWLTAGRSALEQENKEDGSSSDDSETELPLSCSQPEVSIPLLLKAVSRALPANKVDEIKLNLEQAALQQMACSGVQDHSVAIQHLMKAPSFAQTTRRGLASLAEGHMHSDTSDALSPCSPLVSSMVDTCINKALMTNPDLVIPKLSLMRILFKHDLSPNTGFKLECFIPPVQNTLSISSRTPKQSTYISMSNGNKLFVSDNLASSSGKGLVQYTRIDETHKLCSALSTLVFIIEDFLSDYERTDFRWLISKINTLQSSLANSFPALEQIWLQMARSYALQYNSFLCGAVSQPPTWKEVWSSEYVAKLVCNAEAMISFGDAASTQALSSRLAILEASHASGTKTPKVPKHPKAPGGAGKGGAEGYATGAQTQSTKLGLGVSMQNWNNATKAKLATHSEESRHPCFFHFMQQKGCKNGETCYKSHAGTLSDWSKRLGLDPKVWVAKK
jgi:hypothetical protein